MNKQDLLEVISTWNSIYRANHLAYDIQRKRNEQESRWKAGLLRVVSVLEVSDDIRDTPVELMLNKAIRYSRVNNEEKIQEVHELLHTVEKFMNEDDGE